MQLANVLIMVVLAGGQAPKPQSLKSAIRKADNIAKRSFETQISPVEAIRNAGLFSGSFKLSIRVEDVTVQPDGSLVVAGVFKARVARNCLTDEDVEYLDNGDREAVPMRVTPSAGPGTFAVIKRSLIAISYQTTTREERQVKVSTKVAERTERVQNVSVKATIPRRVASSLKINRLKPDKMFAFTCEVLSFEMREAIPECDAPLAIGGLTIEVTDVSKRFLKKPAP